MGPQLRAASAAVGAEARIGEVNTAGIPHISDGL
jgi:hypothetical protein